MLEALRDAPSRCVGLPVQLTWIQIAERALGVARHVVEPGSHIDQRQCGVVHLNPDFPSGWEPGVDKAYRLSWFYAGIGWSMPTQRFIVFSSSRPQAFRYRNNCIRYAAN